MAGGDRLGAPELLGKHHAGQEMRPGLLAEGQKGAGAGEHGRVEPLRAADHEGERRLGAPSRELAGETGGIQGRSGTIQGYDEGTRGDGGENRFGFPAAAFGRRATGLGQLREVQLGAQAGGVAGVESGFRPLPRAADRDQAFRQVPVPAPNRAPGPTCAPARTLCAPLA